MNADFSSRKVHESEIIEEKIGFFSILLFKISAGCGIFIKCFLPNNEPCPEPEPPDEICDPE
jgi:hypothetical protein